MAEDKTKSLTQHPGDDKSTSDLKAEAALKQEQAAADAATHKQAKGSVLVRAVNGDITHLFTSQVFTQEPKKATVDAYLQAQIDAGKVEVVQP